MKSIALLLPFLFLYLNILGQTAEEYFNRGFSKSELQDYRGAIADYTKAIEVDSKSIDAYTNRGLAKIELGQKDSGCLDLSKAGELGSEKAYDAIKALCN